jgi:hypothetical protein
MILNIFVPEEEGSNELNHIQAHKEEENANFDNALIEFWFYIVNPDKPEDELVYLECDRSEESDFWHLHEGKKLFLQCYIVGCDKFGWVTLFVENPILRYHS